MIEYKLKDADGNLFDLNGSSVTVALKDSLTFSGDKFSLDNKIAKRSFLPGASLIGEPRLEQRSLTMRFTRTESDTDTFRSGLNALLLFLYKTRYIVDVTNNMQIEVVIKDVDISYEDGSLKNMSENEADFMLLNPFWEDLTEDEITGSATAMILEEDSLNNQGFFEAPAYITLEASEQVSSVQIYLLNINIGITIEDTLFGSTGYETLIIDCKKGLVSIGDLNRNLSVLDGTGFFSIPVGTETLRILSTKDIDYTLTFNKRYFI